MNPLRLRALLVLVVALIGLSGCASGPGSFSLEVKVVSGICAYLPDEEYGEIEECTSSEDVYVLDEVVEGATLELTSAGRTLTVDRVHSDAVTVTIDRRYAGMAADEGLRVHVYRPVDFLIEDRMDEGLEFHLTRR